jgi:hypothetical protein
MDAISGFWIPSRQAKLGGDWVNLVESITMTNVVYLASAAAVDGAPPPQHRQTSYRFDAADFAADVRLGEIQAEVESFFWCVSSALGEHHDLDFLPDRFCFGDYDVADLNDFWAWSIIDLNSKSGEKASILVTVTEKGGDRIYSFEGDHLSLQNVRLRDNLAEVFQSITADVVRQVTS